MAKSFIVKVKKNKACTFEECPIGLFLKDNELCLKTEYGLEAYIISSGEMFWGGAKTGEDLRKVIVTPCKVKEVKE